ncbi:hypothetical protein BJ912DRAFT_960586 [Pholiota molesta]|nr:hypothetical protein BJ912DRAFT_960586 [Pholiota molesta]
MEGLRRAFAGLHAGDGVSTAAAAASAPGATAAYPSPPASPPPLRSASLAEAEGSTSAAFKSKAFASTLAEALCSRAKRVSERRPGAPGRRGAREGVGGVKAEADAQPERKVGTAEGPVAEGEVPFGRRAALAGRVFRGGKSDDISVIVAVISPAAVCGAVEAEGGGVGTTAAEAKPAAAAAVAPRAEGGA